MFLCVDRKKNMCVYVEKNLYRNEIYKQIQKRHLQNLFPLQAAIRNLMCGFFVPFCSLRLLLEIVIFYRNGNKNWTEKSVISRGEKNTIIKELANIMVMLVKLSIFFSVEWVDTHTSIQKAKA